MAYEQRIVIYGTEPILEAAGRRVAQEVELPSVEEATSSEGYARRGRSRPVIRLVGPKPGQQVGIRVGYAVVEGDGSDRPGQRQVCSEEIEMLFQRGQESFTEQAINDAVSAAAKLRLAQVRG